MSSFSKPKSMKPTSFEGSSAIARGTTNEGSHRLDITPGSSSSSLLRPYSAIKSEPGFSSQNARSDSDRQTERSTCTAPLTLNNSNRKVDRSVSFAGAKRDAATAVTSDTSVAPSRKSSSHSSLLQSESGAKRARPSTILSSIACSSASEEQPSIRSQGTRVPDTRTSNSPSSYMPTTANNNSPTEMSLQPVRTNIGTARIRTAATRPGTAIVEHHILAIAEGRGVAAEVGLCLIHVNSGECILSQVSDSPSYEKTLHKISVNNPQKILLSATVAHEPGPSQLCKLIEYHFSHTSIMTVPRNYFNEDLGIRAVRDFGLEEDAAALLLGLSTKYYCLAAVAAAFRYISERDALIFVNHTVKFSYQGIEGTMLIDMVTAKNLELVSNTFDRHSKDTLFGALDHTVTPMGSRLLRTNILQPSIDLSVIEGRLDAVQRLVADETLLFSAQMALKPVTDLDHITADMARKPADHQTPQYAEAKINHVICLKTILKSVQTVAELLSPCTDNILLKTIYDILSEPKLDLFSSFISETLHEDVMMEKSSLGLRHQRCYAVKAGVNGLLDVSRQAYKETIEDIYEMATRYSESTGLPIKLKFAAGKGFYLTLPADKYKNGGALPEMFINMVKKKKQLCFSTIELLQRNGRMEESLTEVYLMSDSIVTELLEKFRSDIGVLHKVSEAIALLDLLLSFAHASSLSEHVRPEFTSILAIKGGRHPIMEKISKEPVVPNDTFASLSSSFQIITGPNMSGKTTYLKQIALLTIIAQMGTYVPAAYASFRLCDQIMSRFTNDSCVYMNSSAFMAEMREAGYIIRNVTNSSLVLIDELGRATSSYDALGITAAICEKLIRTKAYCFFATHLHKLTTILQVYPNVINLQLGVDFVDTAADNSCTLSYSYTVKDGSAASDQHYGLKTAQLMGMPKAILACALDVAKKLEEEHDGELSSEQQSGVSQHHSHLILQETRQMNHRKKLLRFADKMIQLQDAPDQALATQLQHLQQELAEAN